MDFELGRKSIVEWAEEAPEERAAADFTPAQEKFLVEAPIGSGGMAEVFLVTDADLRRQVAMKVLRRDIGEGREQRLHFIAEAQATSQLEHPGIPPVHDMGLTKDGQLYFTMKLVQGRTVREVLHDLLLKRKEVAREYNLHKLVSILERCCEPLHFSHEKGVIHRDLKPENIMLGDYGEVHVMDWGLARIQSTTDEYESFETVETARTEAGFETQRGAVKGTLPYMSPEQLRGAEFDRRTDVYARGCLLYEVLTLHPAFDPRDTGLFMKKQKGDVVDVRSRNPRRKIPEPLAVVCEKALATDPDERFATAAEMATALRRWLDGRAERERKHEEAERFADEGKRASERYLSLRGEITAAEQAAEAEANKYKPFQPVKEKRSLIEARERVEQLGVDLALAFAESQKLLDGALLQEPNNKTARAELARLWKDRLQDAERRRDKADEAYARVMIERYADAPLSREGELVLQSDPPAEVTIARYEERDGVLAPVGERSLGSTPIRTRLPAGSYLCVLKAGGRRDTRYPVKIERDQVWEGEVRLQTDDGIGEGFVHVPAGPFVFGEGDKTTIMTLPDFAIATHPVTFAEYFEFLATLDDEEAAKRTPRSTTDGPHAERDEAGQWRVHPIVVEGPARAWCVETYGEDFDLRCPVSGIDFDDAEAYCRWRSETTGKEWRLPTEEEREKAARGVDGRRFAWGDLEDASLGKCRESREVPAQPEPVGVFPTARSVYGMGDASGGVWDWTASWEDERRSSRVLRGGSWIHLPAALRCAVRHSNFPRVRVASVGVRCARSL
ncbi:MAG: bifunctional serine/threonine-protein kinase/formylglycine-generating enzyme family protein [Planctomycetota bacterium]|jgi:serine/threonine-protein kinase